MALGTSEILPKVRPHRDLPGLKKFQWEDFKYGKCEEINKLTGE